MKGSEKKEKEIGQKEGITGKERKMEYGIKQRNVETNGCLQREMRKSREKEMNEQVDKK